MRTSWGRIGIPQPASADNPEGSANSNDLSRIPAVDYRMECPGAAGYPKIHRSINSYPLSFLYSLIC